MAIFTFAQNAKNTKATTPAVVSDDPVLLTIGNENITRSEFEAVYKKNNVKNEVLDKKSLNDYLELYINFKLKVKEAEELGLDTNKAFKDELAGYRKQLAQPYLNDKEVTEKLIKEAYERTKSDVRASHILIKCDPDALPKDTLAAYNKVLGIRSRILKGEDFGKLAKENSDDPSAKDQPETKDRPAQKGNGGDLGYFTVLQMVYPFENAAFTTKVGEVSMPVRTRYGYHIIKVADKRPARGIIQVAHIMAIPTTKSAEDSIKAKTKIDELYAKLKAGEDFSELAMKHSDDKGTGSKGGNLPWFGTGRMVSEFEKAAFELSKNGDYSAPTHTMYGWHIIKRIDKKEIPTFDETKADLKVKVSKDSRADLSRETVIKRIKKDYTYKEFSKTKEPFYKVIDSTFFKSAWKADKAAKLTKPMFSIGDKTYSQTDFAKYIETHQSNRSAIPLESLINNLYNKFVEDNCIAYEDSKLEKKYIEFRNLMREYRDGILLFELTDKKVWNKAVKDTLGLQQFYELNKNNYNWGVRADASIYTCSNEEIAKKTRALVERMNEKNLTNNSILDQINKDSQLNLKIESQLYAKGDNKAMDTLEWKEGITKNILSDKSVIFAYISKIVQPQPKTLAEAKGLITADFQNFLEKEWITTLRKKYTIDVKKDVLSTIK